MHTMPEQKPGRSKQDYQTPPELIAAVKARLGIRDFTLDLAASAENTQAHWYFNEQDNGLMQPWCEPGDGMWARREWNWLNPPFGKIEPWVQKACREAAKGAQTAMLVPAAVGSNWWAGWVHNQAEVLFLVGRPAFLGAPINPKTGKVDGYPKDCAVLLYGPRTQPRYEVWRWK